MSCATEARGWVFADQSALVAMLVRLELQVLPEQLVQPGQPVLRVRLAQRARPEKTPKT